MNVLFVDDQVSVLDGIAAGVHFDALGIDNVRYATGAKRALEIMEAIPVDILMCDVEMPGEDGLELIRIVRKKYPDMLTVLLTSHAEFEYAQQSVRLGCFDYVVQPAPFEEIEQVLRRALQHLYEMRKRNQAYEAGRRLQMGEMELLDRVAMNLFSSKDEDVQSSLEMLALVGYPLSPEKKAQLMILSFEQFRRTEMPIVTEKEIHRTMFDALVEAGITYPLVPLSTVDHHRNFVLMIFSNLQEDPNLPPDSLQKFFNILCQAMPSDTIRIYVGRAAPEKELRREYRRLSDFASGKGDGSGVLLMDSEVNRPQNRNQDYIRGSGAHWRALLAAKQYRMLMNEFEECLYHIVTYSPNRSKALCDLHQRMTHMFFGHFYENNSDVHDLFRDAYTYNDFMSSYSDADSLRDAMHYMMKQVKELEAGQAPKSDVEKAKKFISENIADPITVKDVADHVCLSAEYFTKLFKRETGQNIKEYITLTKVEAAKDMLEHSDISVGMVGLELGYTNFSHFSQVFKKYENMTPSEYRSRAGGK